MTNVETSYLCEISRVWKFIDRKNIIRYQGIRGRGNGEYLFNGYRVCFRQWKSFESKCDDCIALHIIINATELYALKWLKWQILCYVYIITIKRKQNDKSEKKKENRKT